MEAKLTHASVKPAASLAAQVPWWSAKDSLSQVSSHQAGVTRSPNHMWHISWRIVLARPDLWARVTGPRKR